MDSSIKDLYEDFRMGNSINDKDLTRLLYHIQDLTKGLREMGPMFHVTYSYLLHDQYAIEDYLRNRGVKY